jgi:uncharacterized protein
MRKSSLDALFPKTRQAVLKACILQPEKWWYLSDLAKFLKVTPSSLQRELASLSETGLLEVKREGNLVYYKASLIWPGIQELQMLLIKTAGISDVIRGSLKTFIKNIEIAFIYGSYARGEALASSDIDLMVIGNVKLTDLSPHLRKAEGTLAREINPTLYTKREFVSKARANDAFLKTVFGGEKIFLKGNEDELKAMAR